jgi:hypothetical protein
MNISSTKCTSLEAGVIISIIATAHAALVGAVTAPEFCVQVEVLLAIEAMKMSERCLPKASKNWTPGAKLRARVEAFDQPDTWMMSPFFTFSPLLIGRFVTAADIVPVADAVICIEPAPVLC